MTALTVYDRRQRLDNVVYMNDIGGSWRYLADALFEAVRFFTWRELWAMLPAANAITSAIMQLLAVYWPRKARWIIERERDHIRDQWFADDILYWLRPNLLRIRVIYGGAPREPEPVQLSLFAEVS